MTIKTLLNTFTKEGIEAYSVSQDIFKSVDSNREDIISEYHYQKLNGLF